MAGRVVLLGMIQIHAQLLHIVAVRRIGRELRRDFGHDGSDVSSEAQRDGISARVARSIPVHARESKDLCSKSESVCTLIYNELNRHRDVRAGVGPPFWHKAGGEYIGSSIIHSTE